MMEQQDADGMVTVEVEIDDELAAMLEQIRARLGGAGATDEEILDMCMRAYFDRVEAAS
jgi:hypothetical protein